MSSRAEVVSYRRRGLMRGRFWTAYATTFRVILSYVWLSWMARLFGEEYREARVAKVHARNAARVEHAIVELQGLFIKVGQLLSIMATTLPEEFRGPLERLQNQVPPRSFEEIRARIEKDLGKPMLELFAWVNPEPLASASLGQVHEAKLHDGTRVVVKVQHADIDEIVRLDLRTIRRIMKIVQWFVPMDGLDNYYEQIKSLLQQELDFELEADNVERITRNFSADARVRFPTPYRALSTKKVLTSTFLEGEKLGNVAAHEALGIDRKELAARLVRVFCQMIFVDGVYHADPHPGNVMVDAAGNIVLLDFGAVAELSPRMKEGIPEFLEGVIRRDTQKIIRALRRMGFLSRVHDEAASARVIEYFHERFQEEVRLEGISLKDIKIDPQKGLENVLDLRKMDVGLKDLSQMFHIPKDWVLLERTLILTYGTASLLDPELNPMATIRPYLTEFVFGNKDFREIALDAVRETAVRAISLPEDIQKFLQRAQRGQLELRVRGTEELGRVVYAVGRQALYAALGAFFLVVGLWSPAPNSWHRVFLWLSGANFAMLFLLSFFARPKFR